MNPMLRELLREDGARMGRLTRQKMAHHDFTTREIAKRASDSERMYQYFALNPEPVTLDPDTPIGMAASLFEDWKKAEPHMREWEETQARQPDVLAALARKYHELKKEDDSTRCLKAYLKLSPDRWAIEMLADQLLARGDKVGWKATYDEALSKPDMNLDHSDYCISLATQLMREERWEEARPYAEGAAESGSARGIACAVICDEGRKDWAGAEARLRRMVERYPTGNWSAWLLWCARTGRGNGRQAEQVAVRAIQSIGNAPGYDDLPAVGGYLIWAGRAREALEAHRQHYDRFLDVTYGMSVVVLADDLKDPAARGAMMARLAEPLPPRGPKFPFMLHGLEESKRSMVTLAGPLNAWLDGKVPAPDFAAIDEALRPFVPSTRGSMEYFIGRLLANHGLPDDANRYLVRAAKGRNTNPWFRALAIRELRRKKVSLNDYDIAPPI
jgi:tetratricopeptide (TPR) repeat protein